MHNSLELKRHLFINPAEFKNKIMKLAAGIVLLSTFLCSCQNTAEKNKESKNAIVIEKQTEVKSELGKEDSFRKEIPDDTTANITPSYHLALTSDALQLVNSLTGSTREITFGKPLDETVETINKVLQIKVSSIGINTECGAGPLKMAVWKNGLNLIFEEQESNKEWQFAGWYLGKTAGNLQRLTTMAGIGIGSSRQEMESAYIIKVNMTSIGYEFSTSSGLYGIFDGPGKNAKITDMWSGLTCIFR